MQKLLRKINHCQPHVRNGRSTGGILPYAGFRVIGPPDFVPRGPTGRSGVTTLISACDCASRPLEAGDDDSADSWICSKQLITDGWPRPLREIVLQDKWNDCYIQQHLLGLRGKGEELLAVPRGAGESCRELRSGRTVTD